MDFRAAGWIQCHPAESGTGIAFSIQVTEEAFKRTILRKSLIPFTFIFFILPYDAWNLPAPRQGVSPSLYSPTHLICSAQGLPFPIKDMEEKKRRLSFYKKAFDEILEKGARVGEEAFSGDGKSYYYFSQVLDGTTCMYEATGDIAYLERALKWAEIMASKATVIDKDGRKNWKGEHVYGSVSVSHMHHELVAGMEMLRLARVIMTDPDLNGPYGARARNVHRFVRDHIVDKWLYKRGNLSWFMEDVSDYKDTFNLKTANLTRLCLDLYLIGGDTKYRELARGFGQSFKDRLRPYKGGLIWDCGIGWEGYGSVDTAHANRYPYMAVELYRAGIVMTLEDLKGLAELFSNVIWNKSYSNPRFTNFINGSNGIYRSRGPWANGYIVSGWMNLGEVAPEVQAIGDAVLLAILSGKRNPSLDYMDTERARVQLIGRLARNLVPTPKNRG